MDSGTAAIARGTLSGGTSRMEQPKYGSFKGTSAFHENWRGLPLARSSSAEQAFLSSLRASA